MNAFIATTAFLSLLLSARTSHAELVIYPSNTAIYQGDTVEHECSVHVGSFDHRIQWREFVYNENGNLVSDGDFISPAHPHAERYVLIRGSLQQYNLRILNVTRADSGTYQCIDTNAPTTVKYRHSAELIVFAGPQDCTTTIPTPPTAALESVYYSTECNVNFGRSFIRPTMYWQGPYPFGQGQSITDTQGWNGMSFYAQSSFNTQHWTSQTYFTDSFLPVANDVADNVPDFVDTYDTVRILVHWPPREIDAGPIKPSDEYLVGDAIECTANGFPAPSFIWRNLRTNDEFYNSIFVIPLSWLGHTQVMMCEALNVINDMTYYIQHIITVNVPAPTTPTTTPTLPPTTTPAAESQCDDLSGLWESNDPSLARTCLSSDFQGNVNGVLRAGYDTYWLDMVGQTNYPFFDHTSWTAIFPLNRAVVTFIGECSKCIGQEILVVNAVSRSKGQGTCGIPGVITYTEQYHFRRRTDIECPPITLPTM